MSNRGGFPEPSDGGLTGLCLLGFEVDEASPTGCPTLSTNRIHIEDTRNSVTPPKLSLGW